MLFKNEDSGNGVYCFTYNNFSDVTISDILNIRNDNKNNDNEDNKQDDEEKNDEDDNKSNLLLEENEENKRQGDKPFEDLSLFSFKNNEQCYDNIKMQQAILNSSYEKNVKNIVKIVYHEDCKLLYENTDIHVELPSIVYGRNRNKNNDVVNKCNQYNDDDYTNKCKCNQYNDNDYTNKCNQYNDVRKITNLKYFINHNWKNINLINEKLFLKNLKELEEILNYNFLHICKNKCKQYNKKRKNERHFSYHDNFLSHYIIYKKNKFIKHNKNEHINGNHYDAHESTNTYDEEKTREKHNNKNNNMKYCLNKYPYDNVNAPLNLSCPWYEKKIENIYCLNIPGYKYKYKYKYICPSMSKMNDEKIKELYIPKGHILFNSKFESGNLKYVIKEENDKEVYSLFLNPDIRMNEKKNQWFYFSASYVPNEYYTNELYKMKMCNKDINHIGDNMNVVYNYMNGTGNNINNIVNNLDSTVNYMNSTGNYLNRKNNNHLSYTNWSGQRCMNQYLNDINNDEIDTNLDGNRKYSLDACDKFTVRNVRKLEKPFTVRFKIENMAKPFFLYKYGHSPLSFSECKYKIENIQWERNSYDIKYIKNSSCKHYNIKKNSMEYYNYNTYTLEFSYDFTYAYDTVYFASSYPYTYSYLSEYLCLIRNLLKDHPTINYIEERLCKTSCGFDCPVLCITNYDRMEEYNKEELKESVEKKQNIVEANNTCDEKLVDGMDISSNAIRKEIKKKGYILTSKKLDKNRVVNNLFVDMKNGCTRGCASGCTNGCANGYTNGYTNRYTKGCTKGCTNEYSNDNMCKECLDIKNICYQEEKEKCDIIKYNDDKDYSHNCCYEECYNMKREKKKFVCCLSDKCNSFLNEQIKRRRSIMGWNILRNRIKCCKNKMYTSNDFMKTFDSLLKKVYVCKGENKKNNGTKIIKRFEEKYDNNLLFKRKDEKRSLSASPKKKKKKKKK
ncbi:hypothetical protein PFMC_00015 [Plasmodium falciparum CAMP/Malaysia]|uniref:Uncharacterized protein n=1 Tax=Plasmodium falciparum (isolate Camp / Malaysia) TaxID=5835 RepID=A0A024XFV1_PLAFC|nr:hypothetical protein PFMC_00015 [Plasmodium falciparum CAMP/Malaysia]